MAHSAKLTLPEKTKSPQRYFSSPQQVLDTIAPVINIDNGWNAAFLLQRNVAEVETNHKPEWAQVRIHKILAFFVNDLRWENYPPEKYSPQSRKFIIGYGHRGVESAAYLLKLNSLTRDANFNLYIDKFANPKQVTDLEDNDLTKNGLERIADWVLLRHERHNQPIKRHYPIRGQIKDEFANAVHDALLAYIHQK